MLEIQKYNRKVWQWLKKTVTTIIVSVINYFALSEVCSKFFVCQNTSN